MYTSLLSVTTASLVQYVVLYHYLGTLIRSCSLKNLSSVMLHGFEYDFTSLIRCDEIEVVFDEGPRIEKTTNLPWIELTHARGTFILFVNHLLHNLLSIRPVTLSKLEILPLFLNPFSFFSFFKDLVSCFNLLHHIWYAQWRLRLCLLRIQESFMFFVV